MRPKGAMECGLTCLDRAIMQSACAPKELDLNSYESNAGLHPEESCIEALRVMSVKLRFKYLRAVGALHISLGRKPQECG
jgi:hypothetical protein